MLPTYPASYGGQPYNFTNVISVMASDFVSVRHAADLDDKAPFSNYGKTRVHLAAPGVGVLSTDTHFAANPGRWKPYSGTSPACAHVAYAAAILKALNPLWTPLEIRDHLIASVDKSPWLACVAKGRLNLDRAVRGPFVITSPLAGAVWQIGTNPTVIWNNRYSTPLATSVKILLSKNGGGRTPRFAPRQAEQRDHHGAGPDHRRRQCPAPDPERAGPRALRGVGGVQHPGLA